jgi:uncharacterized protein YuzE
MSHRISYDPDSDALHIRFWSVQTADSDELNGDVIVDFDTQGNMVV